MVVIAGLVEFIPGIPNLKALRTIRVIRPLRSINAVESKNNVINSIAGIKKIVAAMIKSLPGLSNVIVFLLFVFLLFGILGLQQFEGVLYYRCRTTPVPLENGTWPIWDGVQRVCSPDGLGNYECPSNYTCGALIEYDLPLENDNVWNTAFINYGITSFDQLAKSILAIFQIITLEGWVYIMYVLARDIFSQVQPHGRNACTFLSFLLLSTRRCRVRPPVQHCVAPSLC